MFRDSQIVIIMNFVIVSSVGIRGLSVKGIFGTYENQPAKLHNLICYFVIHLLIILQTSKLFFSLISASKYLGYFLDLPYNFNEY